jgi:hypothetical protein
MADQNQDWQEGQNQQQSDDPNRNPNQTGEERGTTVPDEDPSEAHDWNQPGRPDDRPIEDEQRDRQNADDEEFEDTDSDA